ncbi:hypothetical protein EV361DRAFT_552278 [Lentinula raphanica]|nr:hypothetical protein EV361DRAFT_552278 [Lentinula raphanica]
MNRRESRVSMNARQNDALSEFKSFKKKFLLANKHITKWAALSPATYCLELTRILYPLFIPRIFGFALRDYLAAQLRRERENREKLLQKLRQRHLG